MRSGVLLWATILALTFGTLRLLASSGIDFVRIGVEPYVVLEYPFLFGAVFLGVYGWTDSTRLSLVLAFLSLIGFWFVATGGF